MTRGKGGEPTLICRTIHTKVTFDEELVPICNKSYSRFFKGRASMEESKMAKLDAEFRKQLQDLRARQAEPPHAGSADAAAAAAAAAEPPPAPAQQPADVGAIIATNDRLRESLEVRCPSHLPASQHDLPASQHDLPVASQQLLTACHFLPHAGGDKNVRRCGAEQRGEGRRDLIAIREA